MNDLLQTIFPFQAQFYHIHQLLQIDFLFFKEKTKLESLKPHHFVSALPTKNDAYIS